MEEKGNFTNEAFPTQGGTYSAWQPEYFDKGDARSKDGWMPVPMRLSECGVPGDRLFGGLNAMISMCSFAQANAIAWGYAAAVEAETGKSVHVRVVEHRVKYDIKCYRAAD